jgi:hypothetical protein
MNIKFFNHRKHSLQIFYYILNNQIDLKEGIKFVYNNVLDCNECPSNIGIHRIISPFYAIEERHVTGEENIAAFKKIIFKEIQQYVRDNLE